MLSLHSKYKVQIVSNKRLSKTFSHLNDSLSFSVKLSGKRVSSQHASFSSKYLYLLRKCSMINGSGSAITFFSGRIQNPWWLVLTKLKAIQNPGLDLSFTWKLGLSRRKDRDLLGFKLLKSHLRSQIRIRILNTIWKFVMASVVNSLRRF